MDISEIRRTNARKLADSIGGIVAMSQRLKKAQPQISHIMGAKAKRNIGSAVARQIEKAFNKENGWLDVPHVVNFNSTVPVYDFLSIPLYSILDDQFSSCVNDSDKSKGGNIYLKLDFEISSKSFSMLIEDDSYGKFVDKNDYLVFDPELKPKNAQYVIVQFDEQVPTIMKYVMMAKKVFFEDLTKRYPPIEITELLDYQIYGVAVYKGHKGERLK